MARRDFVGSWFLGFLRVPPTLGGGSDGLIEIGSDPSGKDDWHRNPHSGKPDHQLDVRFPSNGISFNEKGQHPNDPLYRYENGVKVGNLIASFTLIKVRKSRPKFGTDGDDATWVATSGPVLVDKKKATKRRTRSSPRKKTAVAAVKKRAKRTTR